MKYKKHKSNNSNLPLVSIITPNFNGGRYLEETIKSVINQNYKNFEYILIDGKSKDKSLKIIKKYKKYINYFESKKDKGTLVTLVFPIVN